MSLTEGINPRAKGIDSRPAREIVQIMHEEEASVSSALGAQLDDIARAAEDAATAIRGGGKVLYAGAGTSGRLGVMDAAEVPPTFGSDRFQAVMAGGGEALITAVEGAEDDEEAGARAASSLTETDMALGITANGRTPFVISFLKQARNQGAVCWLLTCNDVEAQPFLEGVIRLLTGPEIVAGSTRLKAATATKVALNMISTAAMVRLGKVHDGLMVDVQPTNRKLIGRAEDIVMHISGCSREEAGEALRASGMSPKVAALMKKRGISKDEAKRLLEQSGGFLRKALEA